MERWGWGGRCPLLPQRDILAWEEKSAEGHVSTWETVTKASTTKRKPFSGLDDRDGIPHGGLVD